MNNYQSHLEKSGHCYLNTWFFSISFFGVSTDFETNVAELQKPMWQKLYDNTCIFMGEISCVCLGLTIARIFC